MTADADTFLNRLLARDHTLWPEGSVAPSRLGWIDSPTWCLDRADELTAWEATVSADRVILLAMGGSALAPLVLSGHDGRGGTFTDRRRSLTVVDTTSPTTVADLDFSDALVIVASKSGTTLETEALFAHALACVDDPSRFVVITDEDSPMVTFARSHGITTIFENPTDIGGRFSVFSYFGMVPAALLGYDVAALCSAALTAELHRAAEFGRDLGIAVARGDHELTIAINQRVPHFGLWAEQLIAESTGKDGTGCIPVPTEALDRNTNALTYSPDLENPVHLARAFYELEVAIAICGAVLEVDPFNEPNVAEAKTRTLHRLEGTSATPIPLLDTGDVLSWLQSSLTDATYLVVQAYVPLSKGEELHELQVVLEERFPDRAITTGFGPRYLHSTGQLHKGGPSSVVALQVVEEEHRVVPIPGRDLTFNEIFLAQADGDFDALRARGRTVARVNVTQLTTLTLALRG